MPVRNTSTLKPPLHRRSDFPIGREILVLASTGAFIRGYYMGPVADAKPLSVILETVDGRRVQINGSYVVIAEEVEAIGHESNHQG